MFPISNFDSSVINEVIFSANDAVEVNFYQDLCSVIGPFRKLHNSTLQLNISDRMQYIIDEVYLLKESEVTYRMLLKSGSPCSARVHVFISHTNYQQFLLNGDVNNQARSYCINSTEVLDFKISSQDNYQYFFIGLESLSSTTLNYSVVRNVLEYNITNSTRSHMCALSASSRSCSLSLDNYPGSQEVCVLASLQELDFITLNYTTVSYSYNMQFIALIVIVCILIVIVIVIVCILIVIVWILIGRCCCCWCWWCCLWILN